MHQTQKAALVIWVLDLKDYERHDMKSQREWLQEIMNLSNKHPDIEIHFV